MELLSRFHDVTWKVLENERGKARSSSACQSIRAVTIALIAFPQKCARERRARSADRLPVHEDINIPKIVDQRLRCNARLTDFVFDGVLPPKQARYNVRSAPLT
jgi:hypothetical protein